MVTVACFLVSTPSRKLKDISKNRAITSNSCRVAEQFDDDDSDDDEDGKGFEETPIAYDQVDEAEEEDDQGRC